MTQASPQTPPLAQGAIGRLTDDQLGGLAVALVVGELHWTPDVAPAVMDRISRDAVAYPEQFDRRTRHVPAAPEAIFEEPTVGRTLRRLLVLGAVVVLVAVLVLVAATANAASGSAGDPASLDIIARNTARILEVA